MRIHIRATLSDDTRELVSQMRDLSGMTAYCSGRVADLVRGYIEGIAAVRHSSAQRLGGTPQGHLKNAAKSVVAAPEPRAVVVRVDSPGITRAYRDVEIRPKGRFPYLTIPVAGEAYGKRVSTLVGNTGYRMFKFRSRKGNFLLAARGPDGLRPLYALKEFVRQERDPSLMPPDEEIGREMSKAADEYFTRLFARAAGRATA